MKKFFTSNLSLTFFSLLLAAGAQAQCNFTGLAPAYCRNAPAVTLTPQIANGLITGPGVSGYTFNPNLAGPGTHTLTSYGACTGSYQVTQGTYTTWPITGNALSLGDDQMSGMNPIGFTFKFFCLDYTDFDLCSNGFLTFSASQPPVYPGQFIPNAGTPNNLIAFAWTDLYPPSGGTITYTTIGTAPSRKLVIAFDNINYFTTTPYVSCWVVLYEGTNIIEIHSANQTNAGSARTMGIENLNGTTAFVIAGRNSNYWGATSEMYSFSPYYSCVSTQTTSVDGTSLTIAGANTVCLHSSVTFTANGTPTFTWVNLGSNASVVTVTPNATTTYSVMGTVTNPMTCIYTTTATVNVITVPVTTAVSHTMLCVGEQATITASGASTYLWSISSTSPQIIVNPAVTTNYTLTATNSVGCTDVFVVTVPVNSLSIVLPPTAGVCLGKSITLSPTGAVSYTWNTGMPFQNLTVSPTSATIYSVTGTDMYGCKIGAATTVSINPLPAVNASAPSAIVCMNDAVQLTATGAVTYTWSNGANGPSTSATPLIDVTHYYSVTGTGANGCVNTSTVILTVSRCTDINETNSSVNVNIYPNPNKGVFKVTSDNLTAGSTLKIFNALGALVKVQEMGAETSVDLSKAANGIYLLYVVQNEKASFAGKIVKE